MPATYSFLVSFLILVVTSSLPFVTGTATPAAVPLRFMFITSFSEDFNSSGSVPAMEIALERINRDPNVLRGYKLENVPVRDSNCSEQQAQRVFLNQVLFDQQVIAVLGAGCSTATESTAEISSYWGLSQISYVSSAVALSDQTRFQNYFRTYPSDESYFPAFAAVIEKFNWTRVGIISQKGLLFRDNAELLRQLLDENNVTVLSEMLEGNEIGNFLNRDVDLRVIFLNMYENEARRILCEAVRSGKGGFGDIKYGYAWLTYGWYMNEWWNTNDTRCNPKEIETATTRAIAIQQYPITSDKSATAIGDLSYVDFQEMYLQRARTTQYNVTYFGHIVYDTVWMLALALNTTMTMINDSITVDTCDSSSVPLEQFSYGDSSTSCLIRHNLGETNFTGLSGHVILNENGTRADASVRLLQYRPSLSGSLELVQFASYNNDTLTFFSNETTSSVYPKPVNDGTPEDMIVKFHPALVALMYILAAAGIALTIICCVFNTVFKKKKIIRLTSPNLNYFMIAGAFMIYFSVFIRVLPTTDMVAWQFICSVPLWLDFVGYTLGFSTILAKMWRIYYIFHNPAPNKRSLTDWHMSGLIMVITDVMVVILIIGFSIPEVRPFPQLMNDTEYSLSLNEDGIVIRHLSYSCYRSAATIWLIVLYVFLALLQIVAIVFALQTRKVKIKALNESKEVTVIIYVSSIILVGLVIVSFALRSYKNVTEALFSGGLIAANTTFLLVVFVPKMYRLYRDPTGEDVYSKKAGGDTSVEIGKRGTIKVITEKERISNLEKRVALLQTELGNKRASQYQGDTSKSISPPRSDSSENEKDDSSADWNALEQQGSVGSVTANPNGTNTANTAYTNV